MYCDHHGKPSQPRHSGYRLSLMRLATSEPRLRSLYANRSRHGVPRFASSGRIIRESAPFDREPRRLLLQTPLPLSATLRCRYVLRCDPHRVRICPQLSATVYVSSAIQHDNTRADHLNTSRQLSSEVFKVLISIFFYPSALFILPLKNFSHLSLLARRLGAQDYDIILLLSSALPSTPLVLNALSAAPVPHLKLSVIFISVPLLDAVAFSQTPFPTFRLLSSVVKLKHCEVQALHMCDSLPLANTCVAHI